MKGLSLKTFLKTLTILLLVSSVTNCDDSFEHKIRQRRGVSRMVAQLLFGGKPAGDLGKSDNDYQPSNQFDDAQNSPFLNYAQNNYQPQAQSTNFLDHPHQPYFDTMSSNPSNWNDEDVYPQPSSPYSSGSDFIIQTSSPYSSVQYQGTREPLIATPNHEKKPQANENGFGIKSTLSNGYHKIVKSRDNIMGNFARSRDQLVDNISKSRDNIMGNFSKSRDNIMGNFAKTKNNVMDKMSSYWRKLRPNRKRQSGHYNEHVEEYREHESSGHEPAGVYRESYNEEY